MAPWIGHGCVSWSLPIAAKTKVRKYPSSSDTSGNRKSGQPATGLYLIFVVPLLIESTTWRNKVSRILVLTVKSKPRFTE
jgi:hypothetical protein